MKLSNIEGAWIILQPLRADMELKQSGDAVRGTYHNSEVRGTVKGTLTLEGEDDNLILTGKWADQLGAGDFRVTIGEVTCPERMSFRGNWNHSGSQGWDGLFEGEKGTLSEKATPHE